MIQRDKMYLNVLKKLVGSTLQPLSYMVAQKSKKKSKVRQSALTALKPLVGNWEPHLCSQPSGLELRPFKPPTYRDPPLAE